MKIIDLLNKIANGEKVPEKIKVNDEEFHYNEGVKDYITDNECTLLFNLTYDNRGLHVLNYTVEIIEDKEDINIQDIEELPEYIHIGDGGADADVKDEVNIKINEIIRAVKYLEKQRRIEMSRELHHRKKDDKYALWSTVVDDYITEWTFKNEIRSIWKSELQEDAVDKVDK